jgi:hypothetical protein
MSKFIVTWSEVRQFCETVEADNRADAEEKALEQSSECKPPPAAIYSDDGTLDQLTVEEDER